MSARNEAAKKFLRFKSGAVKVGFARFYNRRHNRRGYFWGDGFKSVIVENGQTLINCLAYIDLNPYQRFKNLFESKHGKKPKPIKGLDGIYSLKRLWKAI